MQLPWSSDDFRLQGGRLVMQVDPARELESPGFEDATKLRLTPYPATGDHAAHQVTQMGQRGAVGGDDPLDYQQCPTCSDCAPTDVEYRLGPVVVLGHHDCAEDVQVTAGG